MAGVPCTRKQHAAVCAMLLLSLLTFSTTPSARAQDCHSGWSLSTTSRKCYWFNSVQLDVVSANQACRDGGANLALPTSEEENAQLVTLSSGQPTWIGVSRVGTCVAAAIGCTMTTCACTSTCPSSSCSPSSAQTSRDRATGLQRPCDCACDFRRYPDGGVLTYTNWSAVDANGGKVFFPDNAGCVGAETWVVLNSWTDGGWNDIDSTNKSDRVFPSLCELQLPPLPPAPAPIPVLPPTPAPDASIAPTPSLAQPVSSKEGGGGSGATVAVAVVLPLVMVVCIAAAAALLYCYWWKPRNRTRMRTPPPPSAAASFRSPKYARREENLSVVNVATDVSTPYGYEHANGQSLPDDVVVVVRVGHDGQLSRTSTAGGNGGQLRQFSFQEVLEATQWFSAQRHIGSGAFGNVYSGRLRDGTRVAIKRLSSSAGVVMSRELATEMAVLAKVEHPNLVRMLGYCREDEQCALVLELLDNGPLDQHIYKRGNTFTWALRLRALFGAAKGLAYLHHKLPEPLVHRDIKPANILLDASYQAKVTDFGLVREVPNDATHAHSAVAGTYGYLAPEVVEFGIYRPSSDVYSFGVVMLEVLTARKPLDMTRPAAEQRLVRLAVAKVAEGPGPFSTLLDPTLQLHNHSDLAQVFGVARLAACCVTKEEEMRPDAREVVARLEEMRPDAREVVARLEEVGGWGVSL